MPTVEDIKAALAAGDTKTAEALIAEVGAKNQGAGISGEDRTLFTAAIKDIRAQVRAAAKAEKEAEETEADNDDS